MKHASGLVRFAARAAHTAAVAVSLLIVATGGGAHADVVGPGGKTIDCYCTDKQGARIELGETICLQVDGRLFMAQCQMSLNVPMWREVQEGCLSASNHLSPLPAVMPRL
ncbi:hypothetical protein TM1040_0940 [Ruegeria sp. TM1040]|uniref:hypothetical protein n=1 Tax=Ruegeria sp. (strain TM1040) TaxID=292414 RepID=UPI00004626F7|nr:hypothetical protein [Ruegeria sp. TM1040]ABF63673.1 hypothetical protein TM1040_0940 [Ruegeria sp. TM1040]